LVRWHRQLVLLVEIFAVWLFFAAKMVKV
jgi:hypothetical protein